MPRRVNVPNADELFRPTAVPAVRVVTDPEPAPADGSGRARPHSGRVKHDEKMTVYISSEELLDLEHARLTLRRLLGTAVDRGRLVRAAIALSLADLEENGEQSAVAQRLANT